MACPLRNVIIEVHDSLAIEDVCGGCKDVGYVVVFEDKRRWIGHDHVSSLVSHRASAVAAADLARYAMLAVSLLS